MICVHFLKTVCGPHGDLQLAEDTLSNINEMEDKKKLEEL